jgi:hypothetical protein
MSWRRLLLVLAIQVGLVLPASAGIFNRKTKPDPAQRVPELINTVKGDPSDRKREAAAEELRDYDTQAFPEIVPVLTDVAQHDTKPDVRAEAIQSLAKMRPVSQEVGFVLEQVHASDASAKVRWQARMALWQYQMAGYHSANAKVDGPKLDGKDGSPVIVGPSKEPPLAAPSDIKPAPRMVPTPAPVSPPAAGYQPLPTGTPRPPLVPADAPSFQTPPPADGPSIK